MRANCYGRPSQLTRYLPSRAGTGAAGGAGGLQQRRGNGGGEGGKPSRARRRSSWRARPRSRPTCFSCSVRLQGGIAREAQVFSSADRAAPRGGKHVSKQARANVERRERGMGRMRRSGGSPVPDVALGAGGLAPRRQDGGTPSPASTPSTANASRVRWWCGNAARIYPSGLLCNNTQKDVYDCVYLRVFQREQSHLNIHGSPPE